MTGKRMKRRTFLVATTAATVTASAGCLGNGDDDEPELYTTPAATEFDDVVDVQWLEDNLDDVALLDIREEGDFTVSHIEGAHRLPDYEMMRDHYEETDDGYEASPEVIAGILEDAGISRDDDVVVYGESSNLWETYGIYTLHAIGHDGNVSLLDGGFPVWDEAGGETDSGVPDDGDGSYEPELDMDVIATREYVADHVNEDGADIPIVDNRDPEEYFGQDTDDDRFDRHGHVTGAINITFPQNMIEDARRLRSPEELEELWFDEAGLDPDEETISYCVSAVRASVGWFVMKQLGWDEVRNYEGSWLDWGTLSDDDGYYYTTGEGTGTVIDPFI
ncbi:sulfurtransferase [Natrialbaceae archaeon AArc-T1-2]|uniref:sulfurtransferase n=1 Tax=Natrialbaceae archaeon AArc-T1-2 TaxID=3053904 RepID=UPI00255AC206|nr:rhodanese-like domain-containing protein [Natrialbaceae archaeon AArc-T1-2]WIV68200.1 rhodanese-like domain-containing protein [Natrialbaceae archaeon AArc-T1-2]